MIYVIDTGYSGQHLDVICEPDTIGHGTAMVNLIKQFSPKAQITSMKIDEQMSKCELMRILLQVKTNIEPQDIVLIPWIIDRDAEIDFIVTELAKTNAVVCSAGNMSSPVNLYSPAGAPGVITVGCINKSGVLARMSNYGTEDKAIELMYGTSVNVESINGPMVIAGTSASASIYAALLDRNPSKRFLTRAFNVMTRRYRRELGI